MRGEGRWRTRVQVVDNITSDCETAGNTAPIRFGGARIGDVTPESTFTSGVRPSSSEHLVGKVLLTQTTLTVVTAVLFWALGGAVSGYSALLGGMICLLPNCFLALRLTLPRPDPGPRALLRAAYLGELGKLGLTVMLFTIVFTTVRPLAPAALFTGFILGQLATFAGFVGTGGGQPQLERMSEHHGE